VLVTRQKRLTGEPERSFFIDWLSLYQEHQGPLPLVSAGVVWSTDADGQVKWKCVKASTIEGSFDTSVQVRCDGNTVFGYDLDRCLGIVNSILAELGLPPFTKGEKFYRHVKTQAGLDLKSAWTGAHITRLDLTANFETGSLSNARAYLEWLATQQASARIKVGTHGDGETVDWGRGSRALYAKAYLKAPELRKHGASLELIDHCEVVGLVRFELTVKATWLHNAGMNYLGGLDMDQLELLFEERKGVLTRAEHTHDDMQELPNHLRRTARDWLAGDDLERRVSLATFKRHRKALLPYGIDIAVRRNVIDFKPRVRTIEVRPARVPAWYDFGERKAA
jgi:hypothetical protein